MKRSISLAIGLLLAGCSSAAPAPSATVTPVITAAPSPTASPSPTAAPSPTADVSHPVGVVALGHSGMTGEGTAISTIDALANSWVTGTNPAVDSIYARLAAVRPETQGHVVNAAEGGAPVTALVEEARNALRVVPAPALVMIATIDADIQCDGGDATRLAPFGAALASALKIIATASPNTKIVVVTQAGRPSPAFVQQLVAHDPSVKPSLSGSGMCDFYDSSGNLVPKNFETLTRLIEAYEAEQARVCALFPQCHDDGGARASYVDKLENFLPDWNHLNVKGQAAEAALEWPVVAKVLGI